MFCSKIIFDEIQVDWRNKADFVKNGDGIMSEEIRDKKITIRVSQREKENIEKKAEQAKMSMSKYLLAAAENKKIRVTENIPHLYLEITRIGVNINQIAHVANSQKYINTQQIHEVKNLLREVEKDMKKVVDSLKDEEETSYENLEKIVLTMEKRMSAMERRMSKLEMNFDQAFYFMGEKLDRLLEEKDKK